MKTRLLILISILLSCIFIMLPTPAFADDPRAKPNNKIGIHILFPSELEDAARLINNNGGQWGYVIIPIQSGDKDLKKWQDFMDGAKRLHVIPIIRLATEGDYFNTKVWRKPQDADIVDFANFLNSLTWPTKNRYVVVYNEVNRSDEWGGLSDPAEYAQILSYAVTVFKSKSVDFFIISSGMDNASITVPGTSFNQYDYFSLMQSAVPGIFNQIDGIASHSYPNPGFIQPVTRDGPHTVNSFKYEKRYIEGFSEKNLPVFITETGWVKDRVPDATIGLYYRQAFESVWNDESVVAVTPFILTASGPFAPFSFTNPDGNKSEGYKAVFELPKIKGEPESGPVGQVLGDEIKPKANLPVIDFSKKKDSTRNSFSVPSSIRVIGKFLLNIE